MHELSIALSIVDVACEELTRLGAVRVEAVRVRVGVLSGVTRDSLLFSFDAAASGTPLDGARLEIEDVPATVWCPSCSAERALASVARRRCPVCDSVTPDLVRGEDLEIVGLAVIDA
jgi:hydrogenase nickel incorporation protein HypA/HybF